MFVIISQLLFIRKTYLYFNQVKMLKTVEPIVSLSLTQ
jgi:hypothetical protein